MREHYDTDVNGQNFWPRALPSREQVAHGFRLLDRGVSQSRVSRDTGLSINRVLAMTRLPDLYDPVDDEVAIERALAGDRSVLPSLTCFERMRVTAHLVARYEADPPDPAVNGRYGEVHWLSELLRDWGLTDPVRFHQRIEKAALRSRRRAA